MSADEKSLMKTDGLECFGVLLSAGLNINEQWLIIACIHVFTHYLVDVISYI